PLSLYAALPISAGFEFVLLEPRCRPRPVSRRATDGLDDPGGQVREVLSEPPGSGRGPGVEPGHLVEGLPLIVDVVLILQIRTRFENDDGDSFGSEFIGQRSATGSGADDDNGFLIWVDAVTGDAASGFSGGRIVAGSSIRGHHFFTSPISALCGVG